jgi:hypothetical protein
MASDNKARSEVVVVSVETVLNLGGKPLLKALKYIELNHLHPLLP